MAGHGPDVASWQGASTAELKPHKIDGTMAFMLESCWPYRPTTYALDHAQLDYDAGIAYEQVNHDLRTGGHTDPDYAALNPQRLVPALEVDGLILTQSVAILEWLEDRFPTPALLPADANGRAIVRAMVATIATDVHPLHNLRTLKALRQDFGASDTQVNAWMGHWMGLGGSA
ncbi:hypothetical protein WR25_11442 [Diploscapter pachys]|uniref:GST N-terminal domain-containing protein n=1 Tax=Diploscapter pachys TaxID=2018661 RepID=A0A2A2M4U6_9BILA|nr:hypothetical protein WR25_11442 [Diploscapter pachys]